MGNFYLRELARDDLKEIAAKIEEERPRVARKFLNRAIHSMEMLAEQPYIGQTCGFKSPTTKLIRKYLIKPGWPYLIFISHWTKKKELKLSECCMGTSNMKEFSIQNSDHIQLKLFQYFQ